jgi:hypothetical protein
VGWRNFPVSTTLAGILAGPATCASGVHREDVLGMVGDRVEGAEGGDDR